MLRVIGSLGLPWEAVKELQAKLSSVAALAEAGAGDGSSPCAERVLVILVYNRQVDACLRKAGLAELLPRLQAVPVTRLMDVPQELSCISWADGCFRAATALSVAEVVDKVMGVLLVCLELAASLGIAFSFLPAKTCILLPPSCSPVAHLAGDKSASMTAPAELLVTNRLADEVIRFPVVDAYKHRI